MITSFERILRDAKIIDLAEARVLWAIHRAVSGYKADGTRPLLTPPSSNSKLDKSVMPTYGLSLSPQTEAGIRGINLCPFAGDCADLCLASQGRAKFRSNAHARYVRTSFAVQERDAFVTLLRHELLRAQRKHGQIGFRPNVFSDVQWENIPVIRELMAPDTGITVYDYTKFPDDVRPQVPDYDLTRSFSERVTWQQVVKSLQSGEKWAIVFHGAVPDFYKGIPVIDGDKSDERFLDPPGSLIGLTAKGTAKKSQSPFIVRPARTVHDGKVWAW